MKGLRDYQIELADKCNKVVNELGVCYLSAEVRTGKSLTALEVCRLQGAKCVLFLTKKKAIASITNDYKDFLYDRHFDIVIINDESMHTVDHASFDFVIHDEHHRASAWPKPGKYTKMYKEKFGHLPMLFLSGTPTPESKMQWFHSFWVSNRSPFGSQNFYQWHTSMGFIKYKFDLSYGLVTNYDSGLNTMYKYYGILKRKVKKEDTDKLAYIDACMKADTEKIKELEARLESIVSPYLVTFTQKQAGFSTEIKEHVLTVEMSPITYKIANRLIKDRVVQGKDEIILADTAVKLQSKLHQIYSGTVVFDSGNRAVLDNSKAVFIKERFSGKKIGVFYKFKAEWDMLKEVYGDNLTDSVEEFDNTDKNIALQIVSGREGISLRNADFLVFLNIDFSAVSYWQARDRMSTLTRESNTIYWVFSRGGIEGRIHKAVMGKKNFTLAVFKKDFGIK